MNDQQHIDLITAYLDGSITHDQHAELNRLIDEGEINALELKEMESVYQHIGKLPDPKPSENIRTRFYAMLEKEKEQQTSSFSSLWENWLQTSRNGFTVLRVGFAIGLLLIGIVIGNWITPFQNYRQELSALSSEVSQMREVMMMSLLDNQSATERLKAVNISSEIQSADERIAQALLKTLNNDPNVNVRLAAVEALVQHAAAPMIREGLVASINKQDSPLVQAALADAMLILQEERSVKEFKQLLDRDEVDANVREKLQNTIAALS